MWIKCFYGQHDGKTIYGKYDKFTMNDIVNSPKANCNDFNPSSCSSFGS